MQTSGGRSQSEVKSRSRISARIEVHVVNGSSASCGSGCCGSACSSCEASEAFFSEAMTPEHVKCRIEVQARHGRIEVMTRDKLRPETSYWNPVDSGEERSGQNPGDTA